MRYRLIAPRRFEKNLRVFLKKHPELRQIVAEKLTLLQKNPNDRQLRMHKLTGKLKDCLAASLTHEYRIVFSIDKSDIFLLAIGTHDEVY